MTARQSDRDEDNERSRDQPQINFAALGRDAGKTADDVLGRTPDDTGVPPFPLGVLPQQLADDIRAQHHSLSYPIDFSALAALCVTSATVGGAMDAHLGPGFSVPSILWACVVGASGVGKSHPLKFYVKPLFKIVRDERQEYRWACQRIDEKYKQDKAAYEAAKASGTPPDLMPLRPEKERYPKEPPAPVITDTTIEALGKTLEHNELHGVLAFYDELRSWFMGMNRYSGGGASDDAHWLTLYDGAPLHINRLTREDVHADTPRATVLGGIQPSVLGEVTAGGRGGTGMLGRILFSYPDDLRAQPLGDAAVSPNVAGRWAAFVETLYYRLRPDEEEHDGAPEGGADASAEGQEEGPKRREPWPVSFDKGARGAYASWDREMADAINAANDRADDYAAEQLSKLRVVVLRLALVLRVLHWGFAQRGRGASNRPKTVRRVDVERAVTLARYFLAHAAKVRHHLTRVERPASLKTTKEVALWNALPVEFSTAQARGAAAQTGMSHSVLFENLKRWCKGREPILTKSDHGQYEKLHRDRVPDVDRQPS